MFNENFSFGGRIDPVIANAADCTSADISPYTSRCSSPRFFDNPGPRSQPAARRDSRFDTWRPPRHPSVTALTAQLEHHVINDPSAPSSPAQMASPGGYSDEGFDDGPDTPDAPDAPNTPDTTYSEDSSDFDPTIWDLSMCDYSATSSPRPSLSLEAQALSSYTMRRRQRQTLVRLQCLAKRTPDIAMLIEECHPSSLPLTSDVSWSGSASRSNSTISLAGYKIEKCRSENSSRRTQRPRKRVSTK